MSNGWGRGPGGDTGPRGTSKVVPCEAFFRNEIKASAVPHSTTKPERPYLSRGAVDMICLPSRLSRLQRSPEHKIRLSQVWTTGLNGKSLYEGSASPTGIILTDVAANRPPDLIFETPLHVSESSSSTLLSPQSLQTERSGVSFRTNLNCSHIPEQSQRSFLSRIVSRLRSGLFCWRSTRRSSLREPEKEDENHSKSKRQTENRQVLKGLHFQEAPSSSDLASSLRKQVARRSFQESHLKPPIQSLKAVDRVRASCSFLDLQREKDRAELSPSRYIEDIEVFHNIRRREIIAKALYRESGQLFARIGRPGDANPPLPPFMLLSGASPLPPIKRNFESDPSMTWESRRKILSKIIQLRPHLESVSTGEEKDPVWEECNFAQDCLRAHNLYRARHLAPPLLLSKKLCNVAQSWANHLAQTGILRYKGDPTYGENIFCRNIALAVKTRQILPDITGEEVAAYWYSNVRQYRFNLPDSALHAHAGSYSQMVWRESEKFGVGKALSRSGKMIVVAHYYPPGNVSSNFRCNVLPLSTRALAAEMLCQGQALLEEALAEPEDEEKTLQKALMNMNVGVTGVLAAQPPNIKGINATKILAAHMLGHAATVVTTPDEKLEVVIVSRRSLKKSKSKLKEQTQRSSVKSTSSSPMAEKTRRNEPNLQYSQKALKEVLNMKLKQKKSLPAPNLLSCPGSGRPPKLSEGKRVKFKSEENINIQERSKAVQTSFSSENLSTEDGNIDFSLSRESSPFLESEETLSWSETISSGVASSCVVREKTRNSTGSSSSSSSLSSNSQTRESSSYSKNHSCLRRSNQETESTSYLTSLSPMRSEEASSNQAPFSSGEFTAVGESLSGSSSKEINMAQSSSSESNQDLVYTPKMCSIRRFPISDGSYQGSLDSGGSLSPRVSPTAGNSDTAGSEDARSSKLNLPFDSPRAESGLLNCYALSPLHY